jgi:hypothetical protein
VSWQSSALLWIIAGRKKVLTNLTRTKKKKEKKPY